MAKPYFYRYESFFIINILTGNCLTHMNPLYPLFCVCMKEMYSIKHHKVR